MVKILACGDFHGSIPKKFYKLIKEEKIDLILSNGDYCGNKELEKLFFKYMYSKEEKDIPKKIVKRAEHLGKLATKAGLKVVKEISEIEIPSFHVFGNWDPAPYGKDFILEKGPKKDTKKFLSFQNGYLAFIDFQVTELDNFILVGGVSSTSATRLRKNLVLRLMKHWKVSRKKATKYVKKIKKEWNFRQKKYEKIFSKALKLKKQTGKKIIFLTHNVPYNTKLDIIKKKIEKGKHYGSYQERKVIEKYKPDLVVAGHIHENQGKDKIGNSLIINVGSIHEGKACIIDFQDNKIKKVKFVK